MGIFSIFAHVELMQKQSQTQSGRSTMPMIDARGVAQRVEALREFLGLGKGEFALSFGLDPSSYSKVIGDKKPLKLDYGHAISVRWGVTMDFIYRGDLSKMADPMRSSIMATLSARKE